MKKLTLIFLLCLSPFLRAEENNSFYLVCPPDVWINCGAEIWDLSGYGTAHYYVNGHQYQAGQPEVIYDLTNCQTGKIYRTWEVEDYNWNIITCTQTIYVSGGSFNYYNIDWPETDLQLYGCNVSTQPDKLPYEYSRPHLDYVSCSMVGTSYKDQVFYFGPDCKKILRKWTVLDWCNYYPGSSNPGIWTYTQVIKVSNNEEPQLTCVDTIRVIPTNCDGAYVSMDDVILQGSACNGEYVVTNNSPYADKRKGNASGFYPIGQTSIYYEVEYACGQNTVCQQLVIVDEKKPVPYCLSQLNTALMPVDLDADGTPEDGMVELWAKDLNYGSFHPCYPGEDLLFSFSSDTDSTSVVFTCANVGLNDMQLWVTDGRGNQSWCAVTVDVQNNAANIPDCSPADQNLKGVTEDIYSQPLENVYIDVKSRAYYKSNIVLDTILVEKVIDSVQTAGGLILYMYDYVEEVQAREETVLVPGLVHNLKTDEEGKFFSPELDPFRSYTLQAFRFGDNSTIDEADVNLLKAYINNELEFNNIYSYIAADVNEDRKIDEEDLKILEEIAMREEDEWPNERQWVFYDSESIQNLVPGDNPLLYELNEKIVLDSATDRFDSKSFVGVLKGDLGTYEAYTNGQDIQLQRQSASSIKEKPSVYPNPFEDVINIDNPKGEELSIYIYSMDGRALTTIRRKGSKIIIAADMLPQGQMLIYRIVDGGEISTGKIMRVNRP